MKILYVIGSFYPAQNGGPNNTVYWQARELVKKGIDVTVVTTMSGITKEMKVQYNINEDKEANIDGIKVIFFDYFKKTYFSYKLYYWLVKNISKYDIVNLTSYFFPLSWISACIAIAKKVDFFLAPRGELEDNALKYNFILKKIMMSFFLKKLFNKARFILVTSKQELDFSKKYFNKDMNFKIVPNYIHLDTDLDSINIKNKKNILYLGRLHQKKGIENLIKAYEKLDVDLKSVHKLIIVGTGEESYIKYLKSIVNCSDNILFLGHKDGQEKRDLYINSKIFVLPSYSENFGNVVIESLMYKTPVISSIYTPWKELEENNCGYWIDNEISILSEHISKILELKFEDYKVLSDNSYDLVNQKYNIKNNIDNFIKVLYV